LTLSLCVASLAPRQNLYIAENLDGINKVHVDTENGSIVVIAKTNEAAASARSLLELTEQTLHIPSVIVGRVVGKNFAIIKEIEQHSGVLRIKVGSVSGEGEANRY